MELRTIISLFNDPKKRLSDGSYMVKCPCHNDKNPSLHISQEGGKILMFCQARCKIEDILESVGLSFSDLGEEEKKSSLTWKDRMEYGFKQKHGEGAHISAVYDYRDERGKYLYSIIRIEGVKDGKIMPKARIDYVADSYEWGLGEIKPTLYRLPELLRSIADNLPIYFVEGEKDCETLRKKHFTATTSGPSSSWKDEYAHFFKGATVYILADNDEPGEQFADEVARGLRRYAFKVTVIKKISKIPKGDVTDFFEEGHTLEEFKEIIKREEEENGRFADWAYLGRCGVNVRPPVLADNFSKVMDYVIIRNPSDDKDLFYGYENGVYRRWNKSQTKAELRKFVPLMYQKDNQITEAHRTLFELGDDKVHEWEDLNANERYINFKNGLYDIEEKKLIPHDPKKLSTIQLNCDYDKSAKEMPVFRKYINDLFTKEDGEIDYESMGIVQEFCGLAISNIHIERVKKALFLCSVRGNTGKTQLMNLITYIIGHENVTSIPIQHMNEEKGRFTMGTLMGKRMIINGDQTAAEVYDSSYFKQLTGGDLTKVESKGQTAQFICYHGGIMVGCNDMPSFKDDKGDHMIERILAVKITHVIPAEQRDGMTLDKMKPEVKAIINWFLEGLHRLIDNGYKFQRSKATDLATAEYRERLDSIYRFINRYEISTENGLYHFKITQNRNHKILKQDLYELYLSFCKDTEIDVDPVRPKNFNQRLEKLGMTVDPRGNCNGKRGVYVVRGIVLTNEDESQDIDDVHSFIASNNLPSNSPF